MTLSLYCHNLSSQKLIADPFGEHSEPPQHATQEIDSCVTNGSHPRPMVVAIHIVRTC